MNGSRRRRLARRALGLVGALTLGAGLAPSGAVDAAGEGTWGWSYCYQYSYDDGVTRNSNYNQNSWTATWENIGNVQVSGSGSGSGQFWQWSYGWVFGNGGVADCRPTADLYRLQAAHANGTATVTGLSQEKSTTVKVFSPQGALLCTTVSSATPAAEGGYPFSCGFPWTLGPGSFNLNVEGSKFGATPVNYSVPLVVVAPPAVVASSVSPNPTTGPVTVSGTTNRPDATVTVRNPDGSVLCTTSAMNPLAGGSFSWICGGTVTGPDGPKSLPISMTTPVGESASTTATVTKTSPPFAVVAATASPNPTAGPATVSGTTNRPGAAIVVSNPDGSTLCTTTGSSTLAAGAYAFSCAGTVPAPDGAKTLTVNATAADGSVATRPVSVTRTSAAPFAIVSAVASPNPTSGPVTVSGTTNRPGASIVVLNPGGSTLCTTTGSSSLVAGAYAFSCAGTVPAPDGAKMLTVNGTAADGSVATRPVSVTRTSVNSFAIVSAAASPNPTTGPVTVSGSTNRPDADIVVTNADGTELCTTTSSPTAVNGAYGFSCAGVVPAPDGAKTLQVSATAPDGSTAATQVSVTRTSTTTAPTRVKIYDAKAAPSTTTGPLTITGSTNVPNASIVVKTDKGAVLCTTTSAATASYGSFPFSCSGTLTGYDGARMLTVTASVPNLPAAKVSLQVTKTTQYS